ncbi:MAG: hypothetical protein ACI9JL_002557 [Paracoccaceae bacterium]|jgi:hypothetical protein
MRILMTAALGALSVFAMPFLDRADTGASAQVQAQVLATKPGGAPADALSRALQQRKLAKKAQASKAGQDARTKKMFQQRQSAFDQMHGLMHGNAKARNEMIRRMQK